MQYHSRFSWFLNTSTCCNIPNAPMCHYDWWKKIENHKVTISWVGVAEVPKCGHQLCLQLSLDSAPWESFLPSSLMSFLDIYFIFWCWGNKGSSNWVVGPSWSSKHPKVAGLIGNGWVVKVDNWNASCTFSCHLDAIRCTKSATYRCRLVSVSYLVQWLRPINTNFVPTCHCRSVLGTSLHRLWSWLALLHVDEKDPEHCWHEKL